MHANKNIMHYNLILVTSFMIISFEQSEATEGKVAHSLSFLIIQKFGFFH